MKEEPTNPSLLPSQPHFTPPRKELFETIISLSLAQYDWPSLACSLLEYYESLGEWGEGGKEIECVRDLKKEIKQPERLLFFQPGQEHRFGGFFIFFSCFFFSFFFVRERILTSPLKKTKQNKKKQHFSTLRRENPFRV